MAEEMEINIEEYLGNDVIERILSFMPIHKAMECIILSRDFVNAWRYCCNFSFDVDFARDRVRENIIQIINQAFHFHLGDKIQRFSLYFDPTDRRDLVHHWIRQAINKGVEEVALAFSGRRIFPLDFSHVDVESVRVLKLTNCKIDTLELKALRFLKNLSLRKVTIHPPVFTALFSSCLALESMSLVSCRSIQTLDVAAQNLSRFKVLIIDHCHDISSICINSHTLSSLHYHGKFCSITVKNTLPQLNDVILDFAPATGSQDINPVNELIIIGLTYVKVLTVTSTLLEGLSPKFRFGKYIAPQFCFWYLKELHLSAGVSLVIPNEMVSFLGNCPGLEQVFIDFGRSKSEGALGILKDWEMVIQSSPTLQSLKAVKLNSFKFETLELELVKFFLVKATSLVALNVVLSRNSQFKVNSAYARSMYAWMIRFRTSPSTRIEMFAHQDDRSSIHPIRDLYKFDD